MARAAHRRKGSELHLAINAGFFLKVLEVQSWLALVMTAWIAPRLITFDLADNALPILLSHPISRFGYVLRQIHRAVRVALPGHLDSVPAAVCLSGLFVAATVDRRPTCASPGLWRER